MKLGRFLIWLAALAGTVALSRRLWRFGDPDPSIYGHPVIRREPGP